MEQEQNYYTINIDNVALDYLRPKDGLHPKRFDAYCALLHKAYTEKRNSYSNYGTTVELKKGQFPTTITDLSIEWKWHRGSIKTFLDNLVLLDLAQVDSYGKFIVITMKYTDQIDTSSQPHLMLPEEQLLLSWTCGYISIEELLDNCVGFFKDTQNIFSPIASDAFHENKGERLHKMMSHLILHRSNLMPYNNEIGKALDELFFVHCDKDMTKLWKMLAAFGLKTLYTELPSEHQTFLMFEKTMSQDVRRLLSIVASYYLPYLRNSH